MNKRLLCKLFGVMKSSYYYGMQPKPISLEIVKHKALIRQIFDDSKQSAGARSITAILMNEHGIKLSRYMTGKLMAQMGLKSCQLKTHKYKHADEVHKTHNNILDCSFSPIKSGRAMSLTFVSKAAGVRFVCSACGGLCGIRLP